MYVQVLAPSTSADSCTLFSSLFHLLWFLYLLSHSVTFKTLQRLLFSPHHLCFRSFLYSSVLACVFFPFISHPSDVISKPPVDFWPSPTIYRLTAAEHTSAEDGEGFLLFKIIVDLVTCLAWWNLQHSQECSCSGHTEHIVPLCSQGNSCPTFYDWIQAGAWLVPLSFITSVG